MLNRNIFFFLFCLLFLPSCALFPKPPVTPATPLRFYSHEELLGVLDKRSSAIKSIEGRISSKIIVDSDSNSSRQLLVLKKPSFIRMDFLTPFGSPVLTMATDGEFIDLQYHSENRFFSGQANSRNLAVLLLSSLSLKDLMAILSGEIPLIAFDKEKSTVKVEKEGYRLTIENGRVKEEILFEPKELYPLEGTIFGMENRILLSVRMDNYKKVKGIDFPASIDLAIPIENYEMKIRYMDITLNDYTGINAFQLSPPEGTVIENLDSLNF